MIRSMRLASCLVLMLLILPVPGCTKRNMYETLRFSQEMQCDKLLGRERDECLGRSGMSYDEYQRQLKEQEDRK